MNFGFCDFGFWIGEKTNDTRNFGMQIWGLLFRQSKIQNQKSKIGGDCHSRSRIRDLWGCGRGAAAGENSPDRNSDPVLRVLLFRPGSKHFANGCASLAMSKEKTFSLSTDMQKGNSNGCLTLQPNWSVSKLTSSSPPARLF